MGTSTSDGGQFPTPEITSLWRFLTETLDRFAAVASEGPDAALHWAPPAADANSIAVLLVHTLGNVEEQVLEVLGGEAVHRRREAEFIEGDLSGVQLAGRWQEMRPRLEQALAGIDPGELDRERSHPRRGTITGRDALLLALRHAGEHLGQSELTRDLWRAAHPNA
jgi:hypothetical protein